MKETINRRQLEGLITKCVYDTLSEQRMPRRRNRKQVMNESQLRRHISQIVNEELENEGNFDYLANLGKNVGRGITHAAKGVRNYVGGKFDQAGQSIRNAPKVAKKYVGDKVKQAGQSFQNGMNNVKNYASGLNQSGKYASAAAEAQRVLKQVDNISMKYGDQLTRPQRSSIRSAKTALDKLVAAFSQTT